jgi:carbon monoxide dehydrogenase subunit G
VSAERTVSATTTIPAAQEQVWSLVSDPAHFAEWADRTLEVSSADNPLRLGSNYEERNTVIGPMTGSSRWTVVEHEAPRRQTHRGEGIAMAAALDFFVELRPVENATEVTLGLRYRPAFGAIGAALDRIYFRRSLAQSFQRTAANLAALAKRELTADPAKRA